MLDKVLIVFTNKFTLELRCSMYLFEVSVTVDVLALMLVLKLVCLDVLPQGVDDDGAGLGVDPQQAG